LILGDLTVDISGILAALGLDALAFAGGVRIPTRDVVARTAR
jgi:hypothetical protein